MFTIKQLTEDGSEFIAGPFESVEMVRDEDHQEHWVVRGLNGPDGHTYQAGPILVRTEGRAQPVVWVMNDRGATVARYLL